MPTSRLFLPPVTQDLWPVIRDRASTSTMATILGGTGRMYVEGEYDAPPDAETKDWARGVIVPVLPVQGIRWTPEVPITLRWLFRVDLNNIDYGGIKAAVWASRKGQLAQREAARQWEEWNASSVLVSNQIMVVGEVRMDEVWQPRVLFDPERTGTVFLSSSWLVDVASASD